MKTLRRLIKEYLAVRRSLGYGLLESERRLVDFASFLAGEGSPFITTTLAIRWATRIPSHSTNTMARRLSIVRLFAQFVRTQDSRTEIPPRDGLPYRHTRQAPYVYSAADIQSLLDATGKLASGAFHRQTTSTLFGLLAVTGMRVGEAIALDREDFERHEGILTIHKGKFGKAREMPLHPTAIAALVAYGRARDRLIVPRSAAFFLSGKGTRLLRQNVSMTFSRLLRRANLADRKPRRPRIHDLRHSFVVHTLCDWYRAGLDVQAQLPLLSTYVGHVNPSSTYWYLSAVPELVGLAAKRLEASLGDLP